MYVYHHLLALNFPHLPCRNPLVDSMHAPVLTFPLPNAEPTPGQGCLYGGSTDVSTALSQQNFVIEVPSSSGEMQYIWTGE